MDQETVEVTKNEYKRLKDCEKFLICLEACGLDNWSQYKEAKEMMKGRLV